MPIQIDKELVQELTDLRHHLHSMAEVSGEEHQTANIIADYLSSTNPDQLQTGVGGSGILATYSGQDEGPNVLIRCELDALPIEDDIDSEYQSKTEGVGHKCGHDGHMAIICGVAKMLASEHPKRGSVTLLFQPAEETGEGAKRVIDDAVFKEHSFDYCFALHNLAGFKKHQIVVKEKTFAAASVGLIARFTGSTAHAAHPEQGKSPALAVAQTVQAFSAAPQFRVPLEKAAKVTVIHSSVGERAFGTSPGSGAVMATLRTYDEELLTELKDHCIRIAKGQADTYGLAVDFEWVEPFPATNNNVDAVQVIEDAATQAGYDLNRKSEPFSWSEDFGHFTHQIQGAMFGVGTGKNHPALHAQTYDFPDDVIPTGVTMFMQIINEVLN